VARPPAPLQPAQVAAGREERGSAREWQENTNYQGKSNKAIATEARAVISRDCFKADNKQIFRSAEYNYDEVPEVNYQYSLILNKIFFHFYSAKQRCISRDSLFHQALLFQTSCAVLRVLGCRQPHHPALLLAR